MCCVIVPIEPRSRMRWQAERNPAGSVVASWFADTPGPLRPAARYPLTATAGHPRYDPIIKSSRNKVNHQKVPVPRHQWASGPRLRFRNRFRHRSNDLQPCAPHSPRLNQIGFVFRTAITGGRYRQARLDEVGFVFTPFLSQLAHSKPDSGFVSPKFCPFSRLFALLAPNTSLAQPSAPFASLKGKL